MGGSGGKTPAQAAQCRKAWSELPGALSRAGRIDRVELKIQLAPECRTEDAIAEVLGLRGRNIHSREVYYLDSPDLGLHRGGVVTRARLLGSGRADLVCKWRRWRACRLPASVRRLPRLSVELDALPDRTMWCVSVRHPIAPSALREASRRRDLAGLHSPAQRHFLRRLIGEPVDDEELRLFGPVSVRKLTGRVPELGRLAVEHWRFPDGRRLVELSTKCRPERVRRTRAHIRRLLAEGAVELSPTQGTKTEATLRHFVDR